MAEWKMISDLKQKFKKELKTHPNLKRMSWKRFIETDDYFVYALNVGQYTHRCVDGESDWVKRELGKGKTLEELEANATRMRIARWEREERAKRKKIKDASGDSSKGSKKTSKKKEKPESSKASLEEHLGNG